MTNKTSVSYKLSLALIGASCVLSSAAIAEEIHQPHTAQAGETWVLIDELSDEFATRDMDKWNFKPESFGVWTWDDKNAVVEDGILKLSAVHEEHTRKFWDGCNKKPVDDFPLYFKSGMAKSKATGVYGYYEAKMKGADLHPGVSPAFWLYSAFDRTLKEDGDVQYSEIDVVELQQESDDVFHSDHNLHNVIVENGKPKWMRPKPFAETNQNIHKLDFDPREEFAIYAVNVTPEDITWYVNGEQVGYKKNLYWHRDMNVALSLGMRGDQFTRWDCNQFYPVDLQGETGLPTTMEVEYIRAWKLADK
ncbi:family 16 glycosylhydrolase [Vibrio astriarenae]|uniref:Family 16 glycosylhydrolase n=1 Tax=Vibrio astriarenae TaxID=1481923 RepID=A0A7Z2T759_9VIBR|nr:family 16 glycosylhydrolase [Vibrio astriarenae]QIA65619.1 family 16 glycosylhydrolase [Vibrio astriarenae]